ELHAKPGTCMQLSPWHKAAAREESVGLIDVTENKDVLPRNQDIVHDEDRVVLVETTRQRIVERAAEHCGTLLVRHAADKFYARCIGGNYEGEREILVLDWQQSDMGDKGEMRQRRSGGDNLGTGDADPGIGLAGRTSINIDRAARFTRRHVAVDRWV